MPALPLDPAAAPQWIALAASYLLGSVPFGWLLARVLRGVDLRATGSGNIGATNAMRVLGRPLGLVAFACDFGKGLASAGVLAAWAVEGEPGGFGVLCGAAAVVGHVWPVYLRFRGGKAVATGCGAIVAIDPAVFLAAGLAWIGVLLATRFVSLASIVMAVAFPLVAWWRAHRGEAPDELVYGTAALALLILVRHRANMARMLAGTESRARLGRRRVEDPR